MTGNICLKKSRKVRIIGVLILLLIISACSGEGVAEKSANIHIAAASDLYKAFETISKEFTEQTNIELTVMFGSTGLLSHQIKQGAPYDIFMAAHESYIDDLIEQDVISTSSKYIYAHGLTSFVYDQEHFTHMSMDQLISSDIQVIAIANPEHAPYGQAAQESLIYSGVWNEIQHKIVYAENVRQAYQYVQTGNADVGIVAKALLIESSLGEEPIAESTLKEVTIDESTYQSIVQALGIPVQSSNNQEAQQFIEFLQSEKGKQILKNYGFVIPAEIQSSVLIEKSGK